MRKQWFKEVEIAGRRKFQVDERLKRLITYNELNLMAQWPFKGKFDVIFCRNVVIYFDEPTQMRIWTRFADCSDRRPSLHRPSERVSGDSKNDFDNIGIITTYRYSGKKRRAQIMAAPARVLVVDDSPTMRGLITAVLSQDPDVSVIGQAGDAMEARAAIKQLNPMS